MNKLLIILIGFFCSVIGADNNKSLHSNKLMKIEIGSAVENTQKILGKPSDINKEKISSKEYEVYEYSENNKLDGFLTIDKSKVVGRSIWINEEMLESTLTKFKKVYFQHNKFEKYTPCKMRGEEEVLIDSEKGIFLAVRDNKVLLVAWADPVLTKQRINQFYEKCAKLQPSRK